MSPTLVEPRVMLAQCLRRLGHDSAAMKHLAVAVEQRPQSLPIVYQFADLAQRRGDYDAAREALRNAVNDQTEAGARRRTAELLARQGDVAEAIAVLEAAPRQDADEPDLLLARLHRQDGNRERTLQMCARLMSSPTLPHIAFAADTYASYGMMEEAEGALAKLDDLELDADRKHLVRAVFAERYGTEESARRELQSAVEAGPQSAVNWAAWVRFLLQRGEADAAKAAITEAHAQLPKAPAFTFLSRHADVLDVVAAIPISRVVAISLVDDPAHRNTGVEALSILKRSSSADALTDADMLELRRLADENPRYLPLSSLVVRLYLAMSRHDEAVALATRGVNLSRHDVEPAWLAAEAAAAAGQWNRALFLAREWRRRSRGQSMMADVAIAQAHVQLQEADHALRQLDPYLDELADAPTRHPAVLDQTVRTLIAAGKADEAEARLSPLLSQDARWRKLWIDLAVLAIEDEQTGAHWLMRVEQYLPAEARDERLMLAQGWYYLSRKAKQPDYDAAARRLLEQITQGEQASAEALVLLGVMRHAGGDEAAAEQLYRRAIAADDRVALAHNNLAALLAERPGQAQAALEAARAAVRLDPANAEYQQTLAGVLSARGDHAAAAEALRQAVKIDPYEPRWQAALIEALSASGDHEEARRATDRFDARFDSSRLPEPMQKQLESLRRSLGIGGAAAGASADGGRLK
jgi:tetratricopeptide (TPR) repeat protein